MSNEDASEDRLTKTEFGELIQHLSVQEILTVEYLIGAIWGKLFSRKNLSANTFVCNLCVLETSSFKNLLAHIDGRKHKLQMERVEQLYHPDYTYPKLNKKKLVNNFDIRMLKIVENPSHTKLEEKKENLVIGKTNAEGTFSLHNTPINKSCVTLHCKNINFGQSKIISSNNQIKLNYAEKMSTKNISEETADEENQHKESNIFCDETENYQDEIKKPEKVITKLSSDQDNPVKANPINLNIKLSRRKAEKRTVVRNTSDYEMKLKIEAKKSKIVINPAATLSLKGSEEKPQYQTDKIIIPTAHKNKQRIDKISLSSVSQSEISPKFSVKSYCSKPNDNDNHGILGVEYVIKILKNRNDNSPRYECGLCELVLDGFSMQRHLEGYNHRLKFCEKHFPTALRHYRQYMYNVQEHEVFKVMAPVLAKLAVAIEQHHGRNLPYECFERDFSLNRHEILAKAFSCRHASEQYGPTFTHVVGAKEIDELINSRHNYLPPTSSRVAIFDSKSGDCNRSDNRHDLGTCRNLVSQNRHRNACREGRDATNKSYIYKSEVHNELYQPSNVFYQPNNRNIIQHVNDETYNLMVDDFLKGTLKGITGSDRVRDGRKRSSPRYSQSPVKRKSLSPLHQRDIWQTYRHMVDKELYNLDDRYKQYRNDPETHPCYNEEWQKFWKRRKDELILAGIDHRNYNYQPEWVRFIKGRIEELYNQESENLKVKSRERLCFTMSNNNLNDDKYQIQSSKTGASDKVIGEMNNSETMTTESPATNLQPMSLNERIPQVVSVLRLMTALEDSLGSLGPKIIDLLTKALQAEKSNPTQVNAIILNVENCSLIETAKEKFKGLVITGFFEGSKERVIKHVINDTELLLKYANQLQKLSSQNFDNPALNRQENDSSLHVPTFVSTAGKIPKVLNNQQIQNKDVSLKLSGKQLSSLALTGNLLKRIDKKELASKLAASLVAQGKTDFDPQQLQELVAVYTPIEEKKHGAGATLQDSSLLNKKTLSDTLSDLLKLPSPSSKINDANISASKHKDSCSMVKPHNSFRQVLRGAQFSSDISVLQQNNFGNSVVPSNSFTSVSQNSSDCYLNYTMQSIDDACCVSERGLLGENNNNKYNSHRISSSKNYTYCSQVQNNKTQNFGCDSNMELISSRNMDGSNNYIQTSNWRNF